MKRKVRLERSYPHPRELVWRTLTDRELLAVWLMPSDFEPVVGRSFTMRTDLAQLRDGHAASLRPHSERSRWGLLRRLFAPLLRRRDP